jgi:transcriptional regulator with XRE-family HTH domain
MNIHSKQGFPKPVTIRGYTYHSGRAAAKALGVAESTVSQARRNGTLDRCGLGSDGNPGPRPGKRFHMFDRDWDSVKQCADALGVHRSTLSLYMRQKNAKAILRLYRKSHFYRSTLK